MSFQPVALPALDEPVHAWRSDSPRYRDVLDEMTALQSGRVGWGANLLVLLVSLVLFVSADAASQSWQQVLTLVVVLLFHETGHYLAMRLFGYANVRMFFIPFFGAAVAGRSYNVAGWKKVLVSLAGPLPGIAVGLPLGVLGLVLGQRWLIDSAGLVLVLNGFNLLPLLPFDGGWIMHNVLFSRHPLLDVGFRVVAAAGLIGLAVASSSIVLGILGLGMLLGVPLAYRLARLTAELRAQGLSAASLDGQSVAPEAALVIIGALGRLFPQRMTARALATNALQVFESLNATPPGWLVSLLLLGAHAAAILVALVGFVVLVVAARG